MEGQIGWICGTVDNIQTDVADLKKTAVDKATCTARHDQVTKELRAAFKVARRAEGKAEDTGVHDLREPKLERDPLGRAVKVLTLILGVLTILGGLWGVAYYVVSKLETQADDSSRRWRRFERKIRKLEKRKPHVEQLKRIEKHQELLVMELGKMGWFNIGEVSIPTLAVARRNARGRDR